MVKLFFSLPQWFRFLLIGGFNSAVSPTVYALLYFVLISYIHYISILILTHLIATFVAFMTHRFLVFRSQKSFLREFLKANITYLVALLINICMTYILVQHFKIHPIIAVAINSFFIAIFSYLGHKYFSFR